jgi:hypothetical protein
MFNITETQILHETLIHIGILEDDISTIMTLLHPYSQQFSTAQNTFPELIAQMEAITDMDELLGWIQNTLIMFDDAITTDSEYDSDHPPYFFDDYSDDSDDE